MFCDFFIAFYLWKQKWCKCTEPSKAKKQKNLKNKWVFVGVIKVNDENSRRIHQSEARIRFKMSRIRTHTG